MWNRSKEARLDQISAELLPLVNLKAEGLSDAACARL